MGDHYQTNRLYAAADELLAYFRAARIGIAFASLPAFDAPAEGLFAGWARANMSAEWLAARDIPQPAVTVAARP